MWQNFRVYPIPSFNDPRRCQAKNKKTGVPCGRWSNRDGRYCPVHARRYAPKSRRPVYHWKQGWERLMSDRFYDGVLGGALRQRFEQAAAAVEKEVVLTEELALVKAAAAESVALASKVLEDESSTPKHRASALALIMEACKQVADIAERVVKLRRDGRVAISISQVEGIVRQLMNVIKDELGDEDPQLVERLSKRIVGETASLHEVAQNVTVSIELTD